MASGISTMAGSGWEACTQPAPWNSSHLGCPREGGTQLSRVAFPELRQTGRVREVGNSSFQAWVRSTSPGICIPPQSLLVLHGQWELRWGTANAGWPYSQAHIDLHLPHLREWLSPP